MIEDVRLFDHGSCSGLAERIEHLRERWLHRGAGFYTLGVASYLDVGCSTAPEETYYGRLDYWNRILATEFGEELEVIRDKMSWFLDAPARFEKALALPGFHIFEQCGILTSDLPRPHFDLQHSSLRFPFSLTSRDSISFTLALKLPRLGGGLDLWDVSEGDLERLRRLGREPNLERLARTKPMCRHPYKIGCMAVQRLSLLHRIGAIPARYPGDQRITLQGHGVRDSQGWVLYW